MKRSGDFLEKRERKTITDYLLPEQINMIGGYLIPKDLVRLSRTSKLIGSIINHGWTSYFEKFPTVTTAVLYHHLNLTIYKYGTGSHLLRIEEKNGYRTSVYLFCLPWIQVFSLLITRWKYSESEKYCLWMKELFNQDLVTYEDYINRVSRYFIQINPFTGKRDICLYLYYGMASIVDYYLAVCNIIDLNRYEDYYDALVTQVSFRNIVGDYHKQAIMRSEVLFGLLRLDSLSSFLADCGVNDDDLFRWEFILDYIIERYPNPPKEEVKAMIRHFVSIFDGKNSPRVRILTKFTKMFGKDLSSIDNDFLLDLGSCVHYNVNEVETYRYLQSVVPYDNLKRLGKNHLPSLFYFFQSRFTSLNYEKLLFKACKLKIYPIIISLFITDMVERRDVIVNMEYLRVNKAPEWVLYLFKDFLETKKPDNHSKLQVSNISQSQTLSDSSPERCQKKLPSYKH